MTTEITQDHYNAMQKQARQQIKEKLKKEKEYEKIKFRIWDKNNGCWLKSEINPFIIVSKNYFEIKNDSLIFTKYTGEKDIAGKEMYVGDIVQRTKDGEKEQNGICWKL